VYLDHVAFATRDAAEPLRTLVGELGGTVLTGGDAIGFRSMQVFLGGDERGMKVELLEPWAVEQTDFLERFLARHGNGVHHLTFKVDDLEAFLSEVAAHGLTAVSVALADPQWREAFLLPRDAHGTVVQLADSDLATGTPLDEYAYARTNGFIGAPQWWPDPPAPARERATLRRVVLRTVDLDSAHDLFGGLLQGRTVGEADGSVELEWDSGARVLLEVSPDDTIGIHRLELESATPRDDVEIYGTPLVVQPPR
jgi:catechol 2,3-dioxygenase-like lactoylglutathione lyase family enzyme